ncbi:MAG: hypothetical protein H0T89_15965 [Deltaproteobacteria bacterium]|nr:hypothetical protein [Deltaproteobacteria bacterium]
MIRAISVGVGLGLVIGCAALAHADVVTLPSTRAVVDVPASWAAVSVEEVVLARRGPAGELLAITRANVPNTDAWRAKTREAYVEQIERGIASKIRGYQKRTRRLGEVGGVPVLDLEARRDDGATIVLRILMFRTYALALAIEVPKRGAVAPARQIAGTFAPPFTPAGAAPSAAPGEPPERR